MKYIVVLADGMADLPIEAWGGKTPFMAARKPVMDHICRESVTGLIKTVPDGFPPGSEIANMNILGYAPAFYYSGRGVLEAAAVGVKTSPDDLVFRCNLVTIENGILVNHSAGHVSNEEASELIGLLNRELGHGQLQFHAGVSYRNLMILKDAREGVRCFPPHDHPGQPLEPILPRGKGEAADAAQTLQKLMQRAHLLLNNHSINITRRANGLPPANGIWPWSPGKPLSFPSFKERWGVDSGAVISAVDLIHGLGKQAGLESIHVPGATGLYNTNYEGKAAAALEALGRHDFVFLHVEAADEAGHEGDWELKKRVVEDFDRRLLKPLWEGLQACGVPFSLALLPDHPTPCALRTHTSDPVPFMLVKPGLKPDNITAFDEESVKQGSLGLLRDGELLERLFE